jgi:hypothetical protein
MRFAVLARDYDLTIAPERTPTTWDAWPGARPDFQSSARARHLRPSATSDLRFSSSQIGRIKPDCISKSARL